MWNKRRPPPRQRRASFGRANGVAMNRGPKNAVRSPQRVKPGPVGPQGRASENRRPLPSNLCVAASSSNRLAGKRVLITAGRRMEPIDPVSLPTSPNRFLPPAKPGCAIARPAGASRRPRWCLNLLRPSN